MDRQNKKCSYARKTERRKNDAGTDKEEAKTLAGTLLEAALEGMANGEKVRGGRYQMMDNIMINGLYSDKKKTTAVVKE